MATVVGREEMIPEPDEADFDPRVLDGSLMMTGLEDLIWLLSVCTCMCV